MQRALLLPAIIFLFGCLQAPPGGNVTTPPGNQILTFEQCAAAGYPIIESYPRECRTPDGKTFVSQKDLFDIGRNLSCAQDADCVLVDEELGFGCCWAGACEAVNYSNPQWIAVNKAWYGQGKAAYCPAVQDCGPGPACFPRPLDQNWTANCFSGTCQKAPAACTSDSQCPSGSSCWYHLPAGPSAGEKGSPENPGSCWSDEIVSKIV